MRKMDSASVLAIHFHDKQIWDLNFVMEEVSQFDDKFVLVL